HLRRRGGAIYGQVMSTGTGLPVGGEIPLTPGFLANQPASASDGTRFATVYTTVKDGPNEICVTGVNSGGPVAFGPRLVSAAGNTENDPSVAYDSVNDRYLVV